MSDLSVVEKRGAWVRVRYKDCGGDKTLEGWVPALRLNLGFADKLMSSMDMDLWRLS